MSSLHEKLYNMTGVTGATFSEVASVAAELASMGISEEELLKLLTDAASLSRLSGLDLKQSLETIQLCMKTFTLYPLCSSTIVNKLICVDAAFAVSAKDLSESLIRSAEAAVDAEVGFDEILAFTAAANQSTARGGEVIGTMLQTLFLNAYKFKPRHTFYEGFEILSRAWHIFSEVEQNISLTDLVGCFHANVLKVILVDFASEESIFFQVLDALNSNQGSKKPLIRINIGPDEHGLYDDDTLSIMTNLAKAFPAYDFYIENGERKITVFND